LETHKRTIARAVTYRILALAITAMWMKITAAIMLHVVLVAAHYLHERVWLKVKWGNK
jgi:uncharacterized membrane protein